MIWYIMIIVMWEKITWMNEWHRVFPFFSYNIFTSDSQKIIYDVFFIYILFVVEVFILFYVIPMHMCLIYRQHRYENVYRFYLLLLSSSSISYHTHPTYISIFDIVLLLLFCIYYIFYRGKNKMNNNTKKNIFIWKFNIETHVVQFFI